MDDKYSTLTSSNASYNDSIGQQPSKRKQYDTLRGSVADKKTSLAILDHALQNLATFGREADVKGQTYEELVGSCLKDTEIRKRFQRSELKISGSFRSRFRTHENKLERESAQLTEKINSALETLQDASNRWTDISKQVKDSGKATDQVTNTVATFITESLTNDSPTRAHYYAKDYLLREAANETISSKVSYDKEQLFKSEFHSGLDVGGIRDMLWDNGAGRMISANTKAAFAEANNPYKEFRPLTEKVPKIGKITVRDDVAKSTKGYQFDYEVKRNIRPHQSQVFAPSFKRGSKILEAMHYGERETVREVTSTILDTVKEEIYTLRTECPAESRDLVGTVMGALSENEAFQSVLFNRVNKVLEEMTDYRYQSGISGIDDLARITLKPMVVDQDGNTDIRLEWKNQDKPFHRNLLENKYIDFESILEEADQRFPSKSVR